MSDNVINWGLSAAFTPDLGFGKITTGIKISDIDPMVEYLMFSPWDSTGATATLPYIGAKSTFVEQNDEGADMKTYNNTSGVNISISNSFVMDALEILARASLTLGLNDIQSGTETDIASGATVNQPTFSDETGGSTFGIMLKGRYGLGMFDLGLGIMAYGSGYKMYAEPNDPNPTSVSIGYFKLTAGTDFKPTAEISVPFELFYEGTGYKDEYNGGPDSSSYSTIGLDLGCEYKLTSELALRGGLSFQNTGNATVTGGTSGPASGTDANPDYSRFGINLGAGYLLKPVQIDGVLGYYIMNASPMPAGFTYSSGGMLIAVSAMVPLP